MSLVEKFRNLKVNSKNTLNNEDMAYCDRVTRQANEVREQLLGIWTKHKKLYDEENLGYKFSNYGRVEAPSRSDMPTFEYFKFSYAYSVRDLKNLIESLTSSYEYNIVQYFDSKYNLKLSSVWSRSYETKYREGLEEESEFTTVFDYSKLIDYIRDRTDNVDFNTIGVNNFKESFKRYFGNRGSYEIKGATMSVHYLYRITGNYHHAFEPERSTMDELNKGFNFFETEILGSEIDHTLSNMAGINHDFTITPFENLTKVKSIRFFKSGRTDIKFRDALALQEFIRFYQLDSED